MFTHIDFISISQPSLDSQSCHYLSVLKAIQHLLRRFNIKQTSLLTNTTSLVEIENENSGNSDVTDNLAFNVQAQSKVFRIGKMSIFVKGVNGFKHIGIIE